MCWEHCLTSGYVRGKAAQLLGTKGKGMRVTQESCWPTWDTGEGGWAVTWPLQHTHCWK